MLKETIAPLSLARAEDAQPVELAEALHAHSRAAHPHAPRCARGRALDIVERRAKADRLHDRRRAGLEAVRRVGIGDAVGGHVADHLAAALIGRHGLEQRRLAVEHADAGRPVELVAGEGIEIAVEVLHVDRRDAPRLAAVDQHRDAARMRDAARSP